MKNSNFGKYDVDKLKENYKNALKNKEFKALVNRIDLSDEVKMRHTSAFEESLEELNNCKNCKGLAFCPNKIKGYVYYPSVNSNLLKFDYVACKKTKQDIENTSMGDFFAMPEALKKISMKDIKVDDKKRVPILKWLKNFYDTYETNPKQKGLYLHGSFGSGKTFMIIAMLNELSKKNVEVVAVYFPELLRSLKEAFDSDFASKMKKLKEADILLIDDIGAEVVTPWSRDEILGTILQYRMDEELPTFLTSNLTISELEVHLSNTKSSIDKVKSRRIIERIKQQTNDMELISENRRQ